MREIPWHNGKFIRRDGSTFIPSGGGFTDVIFADRCGIPKGTPSWWYDIVEGLPSLVVVDGFVTVWDRPGLGVTFREAEAAKYLREEEQDFFE